MLSAIATEISVESILGVFHTPVAIQISSEAKQNFLKSIETPGEERDIIHIFNNIKPNLHLTIYSQGQLIDLLLASTDGHARWIDW